MKPYKTPKSFFIAAPDYDEELEDAYELTSGQPYEGLSFDERFETARRRFTRCADEMRLLLRHLEKKPDLASVIVPRLGEVRAELIAVRQKMRVLEEEASARN